LGLVGNFNFARGTGAIDPQTRVRAPTQSEFNVKVDYRPPCLALTVLRGLGLTVCATLYDQENTGRLAHQIHVILNWEWAILAPARGKAGEERAVCLPNPSRGPRGQLCHRRPSTHSETWSDPRCSTTVASHSARRLRVAFRLRLPGLWGGRHPAHEELIAQRQQGGTDEHPQDARSRHAAQRTEQN